jgi:hypothetical protein
MTENEIKLLRKYCLHEYGRKWSEVVDSFCENKLIEAKRWAKAQKAETVEDLLGNVTNLPEN